MTTNKGNEKMAKALIVRTDDSRETVEFEVGNSYNTIKTAVNGYIECVHLPSLGVDMWLNEEGKLNGLPRNAFGSLLWVREYGLTDLMVGDIILTGGADDEGETLGLTDTQLEKLIKSQIVLLLESTH